jgi:predicted GH43/DUF377 family glycosyl hydrolase
VEDYEMNGFKPGIAYPCGAVIIKDQLFVYYGAADSHVCVATAPLTRFLEELTTTQKVSMDSVEIKKVSLP